MSVHTALPTTDLWCVMSAYRIERIAYRLQQHKSSSFYSGSIPVRLVFDQGPSADDLQFAIINYFVVHAVYLHVRACAHCHTPNNNIVRVRVSADTPSVSKEYRHDTLKYAWGELWRVCVCVCVCVCMCV